jgi:ABC-2 type transport system permease protein
MTTATTTPQGNPPADPLARRVPPLGGFNLPFVRLEVRRLLRNRRTLFFTFVMPPIFYLIFGAGQNYANDDAGNGNVAAFVMISMAIYGAMLATTSGGAMVAIERAAGWSRQLRLTPLAPTAYIAVKLFTAMVLGLIPVVVVFTLGRLHGAQMESHLWFECAAIAWVGSIVFAAFGLFMGYLLPSENVMQILGPVLALLAFAGGLFIPLSQMDSTFRTIAEFTPMYGLNELVHAPLTGDALHVVWIVNLLAWLAIFGLGAAWRFRKDTARV